MQIPFACEGIADGFSTKANIAFLLSGFEGNVVVFGKARIGLALAQTSPSMDEPWPIGAPLRRASPAIARLQRGDRGDVLR